MHNNRLDSHCSFAAFSRTRLSGALSSVVCPPEADKVSFTREIGEAGTVDKKELSNVINVSAPITDVAARRPELRWVLLCSIFEMI
jgi:hypothetical protein